MSPDAADLGEIRRRGQLLLRSVQDQLLALSAREYPTSSPTRFIDYLRRLVHGLGRLLEANDNPETGKLICRFTTDLGSHVRFLESASYPRIPWAVIAPMEKLIRAIVPTAEIVLRSQWSWNYKIRQMSVSYQEALEAIPREYLADSVFSETEPAWHVVSLPRIDSGNVLMHVILGHEVGHRIADRFLDKEDRLAIQKEIAELVGDAKWADPDIDNLNPVRAMAVRNRVFKRINDIRVGGVQELLSDIVGLQVFGPSFLFALRESSVDDTLDGVPAPDSYHPPWRYRYRNVLKEFAREGYVDLVDSLGGTPVADRVRDACRAHLEGLQTLGTERGDLEAIETDEYARRAYRLIEKTLDAMPTFVAGELRALTFDKAGFKKKLEALLGLLALGIPPIRALAPRSDFRYAILAGWCGRIARLCFDPTGPWTIEDDLTLHRLVHKALEYLDLTDEYDAWGRNTEGR
jgi:hypothetical protein